jgi:histidyl-tRNA synthetase
MVRGLDYYTNTVFEVTHPELGAQDAIAAGGRYDTLIEDFGGKRTGAFGFAIGLERLLMALFSKRETDIAEKKLDLYIATTSPKVYTEAFKTLITLRRVGLFCEIDFHGKSLKSQMRQANKRKAAFVAIFGDEELKRGEVILRNMKTSEQRNIKLCELSSVIKK